MKPTGQSGKIVYSKDPEELNREYWEGRRRTGVAGFIRLLLVDPAMVGDAGGDFADPRRG